MVQAEQDEEEFKLLPSTDIWSFGVMVIRLAFDLERDSFRRMFKIRPTSFYKRPLQKFSGSWVEFVLEDGNTFRQHLEPARGREISKIYSREQWISIRGKN